MLLDITSIEKKYNDIKKVSNALYKLYQSDWDDEVHMSFQQYIDLCNKQINILSEKIDVTINVCKQINSVDIDGKIVSANNNIESAEKLLNTINKG